MCVLRLDCTWLNGWGVQEDIHRPGNTSPQVETMGSVGIPITFN